MEVQRNTEITGNTMKRTIRLTEAGLHRLINESIKKVLKESGYDIQQAPQGNITYQGGENNEDWDYAGISPMDVTLVPDQDVAQYHFSR
jgi:uncharacterized protein YajQ (UPF0234 family)